MVQNFYNDIVFLKVLLVGVGDVIRTHGLQCHNTPYNFFLSIYRYFKPFLLQTNYSLTILFPLNPLILILSMGYHVVVKNLKKKAFWWCKISTAMKQRIEIFSLIYLYRIFILQPDIRSTRNLNCERSFFSHKMPPWFYTTKA